MLTKVWKNYSGSGSYHGNGHCENDNCPGIRWEKSTRKAVWFLYYKTTGNFASTDGYCSLKCAVEKTGYSKAELLIFTRRKKMKKLIEHISESC